MRIIMHVDLDAFYASCEEREHPEYKGKPLIVGADPKGGTGRGVVATCNYEARKYGVRSAMPITRAYKLCPNGIYVRPNFPLYEETSARIMKILRKYADKLEIAGLDEAYLDVSRSAGSFKIAKEIAEKIKKEILEKEKLTCSVGISVNKLIAKMASDFQKPGGITIVTENEIKDFINPLGVRKILGVGPKTEQKLKEMGIETIKDLAKLSKKQLIEEFGNSMGDLLYKSARGIDESEVIEEQEIKSIGREYTFEKDTDNIDEILNTIDKLSEETIEDVLKSKLFFKTITIKLRYHYFETHTFSKTLDIPTNDLETLKIVAKELLRKHIKDEKIRLIGVRVHNFSEKEVQKSLKMI